LTQSINNNNYNAKVDLNKEFAAVFTKKATEPAT